MELAISNNTGPIKCNIKLAKSNNTEQARSNNIEQARSNNMELEKVIIRSQ